MFALLAFITICVIKFYVPIWIFTTLLEIDYSFLRGSLNKQNKISKQSNDTP